MMTRQPDIFQDAPGLERQNDVLESVAHAHPSTQADIEAATGIAAPADTHTIASGSSTGDHHQMQHAESYGQRLTRVLTGEAEESQAGHTDTDDGGSTEGRSRRKKMLPFLVRQRKRPSKRRNVTSDSLSRSTIRQRADELARMADSEKMAQSQAQHNKQQGRANSNNDATTAASEQTSSESKSEPERIKMVGEDGKPMRRHGIKERVLHFTPSWFSVTMGTGVVATLLNLLPWASIHSGLRWPALCFLLADIVIFILFLCAFFARYLMYPEVLPLTIKHPQKSMFLGTIPMGLITIISGIAQLGTKEFELGMGFALAASGLWWFATALSLLTAIGVPFSMMTYQKHYFEGITAALLLPIVPPITAAATGSVIAEIIMHDYPTYAFTIMVVSYLVLGIGLPLALLILVLYFQRLLLFKSPPRDVIISVFLPLGPCGQGGEACLHLGRVALHLFPTISTPTSTSGVPQLFSVGQALYGAGLISAMLLFGLGIWWLCIGLFTIIRELRRGKLGFNMGWWGLTFPFASLAICTARIAIELNSLTLKITYTAFVIGNISLWLYVAIPTVRGAWSGRLFNAPCLADLPLKP